MPKRSAAPTAALVITAASEALGPESIFAIAIAFSFLEKEYSDFIS
jgi:hypothetical protein